MICAKLQALYAETCRALVCSFRVETKANGRRDERGQELCARRNEKGSPRGGVDRVRNVDGGRSAATLIA